MKTREITPEKKAFRELGKIVKETLSNMDKNGCSFWHNCTYFGECYPEDCSIDGCFPNLIGVDILVDDNVYSGFIDVSQFDFIGGNKTITYHVGNLHKTIHTER